MQCCDSRSGHDKRLRGAKGPHPGLGEFHRRTREPLPGMLPVVRSSQGSRTAGHVPSAVSAPALLRRQEHDQADQGPEAEAVPHASIRLRSGAQETLRPDREASPGVLMQPPPGQGAPSGQDQEEGFATSGHWKR
ncbi:uncharacterized protein LOC143018640 [Oratosquilla oratoria]|uniref:uncharacterized protein LOC143018640 n=1 Tax=Oratosquilla oratoria TaxID=337810 RepID=UPI003F772D29